MNIFTKKKSFFSTLKTYISIKTRHFTKSKRLGTFKNITQFQHLESFLVSLEK